MLRVRAESFPFMPSSGRKEEAKGLRGVLVRVTMKYRDQRQLGGGGKGLFCSHFHV